uniref:Gag-pol polyprotein n=1 Tax=Solanum tuberosum TaxID=4113 RepID=M1DTD9_SOLTU
MNTRTTNSRRIKGENTNQEAPPQALPQAPIDPLTDNVTNAEIRSAFQELAQEVMAQDNREVVSPVNPSMSTTEARVRDFTRMNPPKFHGSKLEENPQEFIDEVYKILVIMGVTLVEKAELAAYQVKGVGQIWFNHWKEERSERAGPIEWERTKMIKFVSGVSNLVVKECRTALLMHDMDISCLLVHSQQIDEEKLKERSREAKREERTMVTTHILGPVDGVIYGSDKGSPSKVLLMLLQGLIMKGCLNPNLKETMNHKIRNCPLVSKNEGDNLRRAQPNPSYGPSGSGAMLLSKTNSMLSKIEVIKRTPRMW